MKNSNNSKSLSMLAALSSMFIGESTKLVSGPKVKVCLHPDCNKKHTHNNSYCCAEHCKEHKLILKNVLKLKNSAECAEWLADRMLLGHSVTAIKGKAPDGAMYSDGKLIKQPINLAWRDTETGEIFHLKY